MNKKWIMAIYVFIAYIAAGYSQDTPDYVNLDKFTTLDSAYLKCAYKLTYLRDSLKPNAQFADDQMLLIGQSISKYYSQKKLDHNQYIKEKFADLDAYPGFPAGVWSCELFKNYPQGKVTVCDIGSVLRGNFVYQETSPTLDWTIDHETQTVLSYNCQKATISFRGRDYIAWFTP
ncbi:MAG: GLPGLI family protein, partial [Dysgonamonadaceae bacterium]|nr:GLPGLI family protein [Dysgonamonadaceae bacterium]